MSDDKKPASEERCVAEIRPGATGTICNRLREDHDPLWAGGSHPFTPPAPEEASERESGCICGAEASFEKPCPVHSAPSGERWHLVPAFPLSNTRAGWEPCFKQSDCRNWDHELRPPAPGTNRDLHPLFTPPAPAKVVVEQFGQGSTLEPDKATTKNYGRAHPQSPPAPEKTGEWKPEAPWLCHVPGCGRAERWAGHPSVHPFKPAPEKAGEKCGAPHPDYRDELCYLPDNHGGLHKSNERCWERGQSPAPRTDAGRRWTWCRSCGANRTGEHTDRFGPFKDHAYSGNSFASCDESMNVEVVPLAYLLAAQKRAEEAEADVNALRKARDEALDFLKAEEAARMRTEQIRWDANYADIRYNNALDNLARNLSIAQAERDAARGEGRHWTEQAAQFKAERDAAQKRAEEAEGYIEKCEAGLVSRYAEIKRAEAERDAALATVERVRALAGRHMAFVAEGPVGFVTVTDLLAALAAKGEK